MSTYLIDNDGACWNGQSRRLQQRFEAHCSSATFERFIIRNLGFVSVQFAGTSCFVKVAPAHLSLKAFMKLSALLLEREVDRYAVSLFEDGWRHLLLSNSRTVLHHLIQASDRSGSGDSDEFASRARSISSLPSSHPLLDLLDAWRANSGCIDVSAHSKLLRDRLSGRFAVIERETNTGNLVFSRIGQGFAMYDSGWPERMLGYPINCQPDVKYGQWIDGCLRSAFDCIEPTLHDVDASITNPVAKTTRRVRYTRLTLPCRDRHGVTRMLGASLVDTGVSLSVELT